MNAIFRSLLSVGLAGTLVTAPIVAAPRTAQAYPSTGPTMWSALGGLIAVGGMVAGGLCVLGGAQSLIAAALGGAIVGAAIFPVGTAIAAVAAGTFLALLAYGLAKDAFSGPLYGSNLPRRGQTVVAAAVAPPPLGSPGGVGQTR